MKSIQIISAISFVFQMFGCSYTDNQELKSDLLLIGMACLFTLMYSSHLVGIQNQNKEKDEK
jgi:Na+/H+ antiporter NhaC